MEFTCASVTREIAGKKFVLRMDFNALALAEKTTGENFLDPAIFKVMGIGTATAMFWACAVQTEPKLTLQAVRSLGYKHIAAIVDACRAAYRAANEIPEEDARPTSGLQSLEAVPAQ